MRPLKKVEDLKDRSIQLSIVLDSKQEASGILYLETGPKSPEDEYSLYQISMSKETLKFTTVSTSNDKKVNMTQISRITLAFTELRVEVACAMLKDKTTVKILKVDNSLYVYDFDKVVFIQPYSED